MTAEIPEWALREAGTVLMRYGPYQDNLIRGIATALLSVARARDERAAGIARDTRIATAILADDGGKPDG